ncbi:hypothetical protein SAMN04487914_101108 [Arthrobacter sp. ok909]|nr:hypothetical protein SAMN04487914_101108 [Arthrobacter sp. ok909]
MHFRRGLGPGGHLEFDLDTVHSVALAGLADLKRWPYQPDFAHRGRLAKAGTDLALRAALECGTLHVAGPASHGRAGVNVLRDSVLHKALRGDHGDAPGVGIFLGGNAEEAAEVVDVAV